MARCLGDRLWFSGLQPRLLLQRLRIFIDCSSFSESFPSTFAGASAATSSLSEQPGFGFPTDLPVRRVVPPPSPRPPPCTQCFGTVTMLAGAQAEHPPPLFPGPWECNTLLTKSHFPFLSNFHTRAPSFFPPRAGRPPEKGSGVTCV